MFGHCEATKSGRCEHDFRYGYNSVFFVGYKYFSCVGIVIIVGSYEATEGWVICSYMIIQTGLCDYVGVMIKSEK